MRTRIYLSPPHMGNDELKFVQQAFESNYIAPLGPQVDQFESEFAQQIQAKYAVAVSSGTAALHLALRFSGVGPGDEVLCSTFTFVASANAIRYLGADPVFIDSDPKSWNLDPELLEQELRTREAKGKLPKALVVVHLYGGSADLSPIVDTCEKHGVFLIEDAAESLGALYKNQQLGTFGHAGIFSFNGNKIITTSGGGMIVSNDHQLMEKVKFWATQARDPAKHYEHSELGYNYRMSNVLAAIGRGQLRVLADHVRRKREINQFYRKYLGELPGIMFMPEPDWSYSTYWLTSLTIDPEIAGIDRNSVIDLLEKHNIESRPTWKPMHLQPLYESSSVIGGKVSEYIFKCGLCLPSGSALDKNDLERIVAIVQECWKE